LQKEEIELMFFLEKGEQEIVNSHPELFSLCKIGYQMNWHKAYAYISLSLTIPPAGPPSRLSLYLMIPFTPFTVFVFGGKIKQQQQDSSPRTKSP
jgi:hypothetical protein